MMGYLEVSLRPQRQHTQDYHTRYSWLVEVVYRLLYARRVNNKYLSGHLPYYDGVRVLALPQARTFGYFHSSYFCGAPVSTTEHILILDLFEKESTV